MATRINSRVPASALARSLSCELLGEDREVAVVGALSEAGRGCLTFCKDVGAAEVPAGSIVIAPKPASGPCDAFTHLASEKPRLDFIRALQLLDLSPGYSRDSTPPNIHPDAVVASSAVIEPGCTIESGVVIEHNVMIYSGTWVGAGSRINAGAVVGRDGFGFERDESGHLQKFVHLGGVRIGRNVEIGCHACISRGALGMTTIDDGVKIDALVYIAHNCHVEADAIIIAGAEVSGGVRVGQRAWIGPRASVMQKVSIGSDSLVGLGAVVIRDVPAGAVVAGNPARILRGAD